MKINPWARRQSRRALVQALYQWQMGGNPASAVLQEFLDSDSLKKADRAFFSECFAAVVKCIDRTPNEETPVSVPIEEQLDPLFAELLDRQVSELDQVERAILRLGTFELKHRIDVPYRVVIDEYVELAKVFGAEESHKYINAILDSVAKQTRSAETAHDAIESK
ncbi:MAG: transcription antitermination factor NusB [Pseudomonadales bacterium]